MDEIKPFGMATDESPYDSRTYTHDTTLALPLVSGGYDYKPTDIEHQHNVGICTAISLTQNAAKVHGRKYSADFQYLLQKKFIDLNWVEGSSIFSALKVGKTYGFLPVEYMSWVTENDRYMSYPLYIAKLQSIPTSEIQRLLSYCTDKLTGYAQLPTHPESLAKGITDSQAGIICRYEVGMEWFTPSWASVDIDPLRPPKHVIAGHAIGVSEFNFTNVNRFTLPNTWGIQWNDKGRGHTISPTYECTEAWIPYYSTVPTPLPQPFVFTQDMKYGETSNDVKQLQKRLGVLPLTGYYGDMTRNAVFQYQLANIQLSWYERYVLKGKVAGAKTRAALNTS